MSAAEDETREQLESRQEIEEGEVEELAKARLVEVTASAGKGKKAKVAIDVAEREVEQWRYDLSVRHKEELEALQEREGQAEGATTSPVGREGVVAAAAPEAAELQLDGDAERAQRKKDKAQKKRENRVMKEQDREEEKEREKREAGPSRRELELADLTALLAKQRPRLRMHEVLGDGHCLYRAVADQLRRYRPDLHKWANGPDRGYEEMRALCAGALQQRRDEYEPFAELKDGEDYSQYCSRVQSSADWGGHLELRALADQLGGEIHVYRAAEKEPLSLGSPGRGDPLRVAFHQYWLASGEHYNSVVLLDDAST